MADPTSPGMRFCDLGTMSINRGSMIEPVRGRRLTAALTLLLVRANQHVSTDSLVDAMWGDAPLEESVATLRTHIWRLRRFLDPDRHRGEPFTTIVSDGTGFRLAVTVDQVDSLRFETLAGEARDLLVTQQPRRALARCDEALALWRGQPWSPHSDEPWAMAAAGRLREIREQVQEHRIDSLLQLGDPEPALADVELLLADAPLRESLWALAMLAAYRAGRVDQALDTYRRARQTLIDEAGIEPGAELRELHAKMLTRAPDLDQRPARSATRETAQPTEVHLPERRTELLGRTDTVGQLVEAVIAKPLVTVVGAAGCGKTRLSIEVARSAAQAFADGVWFIDLTAADDASQLLDVITTGLGMTAPAVGTIVEALRAFTSNRQMLIVLDNCEHLLDEVSTLADALLGTNSELTILATSREPLDLDDEYIWTLQPLASRTAGFPMTEAPAVKLFLQRLAAAAPTVHPGDRETELVVEICEGVDGLPLAIELAASLARSFTLDEIATRVRSDLVSLSRIGRGGSSHHATLRGAIELSTASLDPVELAVHRAVAVVPGPFTSALAAHLVDIDHGPASNALAGLVHRSLLTPRGAAHSQGPSRFDQLATVRAHGLSAAADQPARAARRRDEWVAGLVADMPPLGDAEELAWHARLDDDYAAVRATLQHCLVEEPDPIGPSTAARLGMYWFYRGMAVEWRHWTALARQSDVADPYDKLLVGSSYAGVAGLVEGGNLYRAWLDDLDRPTISMSYEQTVGLAQYLPAVCLTAWLTGAADVCQRATDKLRDFAHETGHPRLELFAAVTDVLTRSQGGDPSVLRDIEQCYQRAQSMDNFYARWITSVAGVVAGLTTQRPEHGMRWSNLQMHEFTTLGFEVNVPGLELRGALLTMTGQPYEAIRALAQSRGLARRIGLRWPSLPSTPDTLAAAEDQLTTADCDRAYREGTLSNLAAPTP